MAKSALFAEVSLVHSKNSVIFYFLYKYLDMANHNFILTLSKIQNILKYELYLPLFDDFSKGSPSPSCDGINTKASPILKLKCKICS